jgi:anti-anti-sigma factor
MPMELLARDEQSSTWAATGELDLFSAPELRAVLADEIERGRGVILDLSRLTFFESTGAGVLISASKRATSRGVRFALRRNASPPVMALLGEPGLDERFEWVPAGGEDDEGPAGVREPRRPPPSGGGTSARAEG